MFGLLPYVFAGMVASAAALLALGAWEAKDDPEPSRAEQDAADRVALVRMYEERDQSWTELDREWCSLEGILL